MLQLLYRCLLRLHPHGFRTRFSDEMLSIFESASGKTATRLVWDALLSLLRQWVLRPEFWHDFVPTTQGVGQGIPSFQTLEPFRPRMAAMIQGLLLSSAVFCGTCFAIRYSWIHLLHVRIPEVQFGSAARVPANAGQTSTRRPSKQTESGRSKVAAENPVHASATLAVDPQTISDRQPVDVHNPPALMMVNPKLLDRPLLQGELPDTGQAARINLLPYAGRYVSRGSDARTIVITVGFGHLAAEIGGTNYVLAPLTATQFIVLGVQNGWIEFVSDDNGEIRQLRLSRSGVETTAYRQ